MPGGGLSALTLRQRSSSPDLQALESELEDKRRERDREVAHPAAPRARRGRSEIVSAGDRARFGGGGGGDQRVDGDDVDVDHVVDGKGDGLDDFDGDDNDKVLLKSSGSSLKQHHSRAVSLDLGYDSCGSGGGEEPFVSRDGRPGFDLSGSVDLDERDVELVAASEPVRRKMERNTDSHFMEAGVVSSNQLEVNAAAPPPRIVLEGSSNNTDLSGQQPNLPLLRHSESFDGKRSTGLDKRIMLASPRGEAASASAAVHTASPARTAGSVTAVLAGSDVVANSADTSDENSRLLALPSSAAGTSANAASVVQKSPLGVGPVFADPETFSEELHKAAMSRFSFWPYLREEISGQYAPERDFGREREAVYNFVNVPAKLESLLFFGVLVCVDSFLFLVTFMPVRFLVVLFKLTLRLLSHLVSAFTLGMVRPLSWPAWRNFCSSNDARMWDLVRGVIILCVVCVLLMIDASRIYHYIRGQAIIKLYVIFNVLEVFDKLCCSFGRDIYDALLSVMIGSSQTTHKGGNMHPIVLTFVALTYTVVHSVVLLASLVTLNVAINSHNNGLLTLLVSNQFVELKGGVFKKFATANLFQISCHDIVERFQLAVFLGLIALLNFDFLEWHLGTHSGELALSGLAVFLSEFFVDWIKHAFITRFNDIPLESYRQFKLALLREVAPRSEEAEQQGHSDYFLVDTYSICRRIGFVPLPLFCLCLRVFARLSWPPGLAHQPGGVKASLLFGFYVVLCLVKVLLRRRLVRRGLREQRLEKFRLPASGETDTPSAEDLPERFERVK